jgi:hypothetical protein
MTKSVMRMPCGGLHFFCVSRGHLSAPFTRPVLVLISVPRRHVDDRLSQCCWTAWAAHSAVVPSVPLPLGHDVSAIRADRGVIGGVTSAKDPHFIARPTMGAFVFDKLTLHRITKVGSSIKQLI